MKVVTKTITDIKFERGDIIQDNTDGKLYIVNGVEESAKLIYALRCIDKQNVVLELIDFNTFEMCWEYRGNIREYG